MNDWGFVGRWQAAWELAMLTYMDLAKCLDKLQMIDAFRVTLPYLRTVWETDTLRAYFEGLKVGSYYAWGGARVDGGPPGWEAEDEGEANENADTAMEAAVEKWKGEVEMVCSRISEALDNLERHMAEEGMAVWCAFSGFCVEEMGLDALNLLSAFGSFAERAKAMVERAERLEVEPDSESVEEYRAVLSGAWHLVLKKG
jgi:hypothetical protein